MRGILVAWLIKIHLQFKLKPETLFLAINLIDRFSESTKIKKSEYQLVGVTGLLIAAKIEEIYAPEVQDMVFVTAKSYTREQILKMEHTMLLTLSFNTNVPSSYRFLERLVKLSKSDDLVFNYAHYIIELTLSEHRFYKYSPSMLASGSLYLAKKMMKRTEPWNDFLELQTNHKECDVRKCARDLCY